MSCVHSNVSYIFQCNTNDNVICQVLIQKSFFCSTTRDKEGTSYSFQRMKERQEKILEFSYDYEKSEGDNYLFSQMDVFIIILMSRHQCRYPWPSPAIILYHPSLLVGACGVVIIVVGNEHGDTSSNPGRDWLHFT